MTNIQPTQTGSAMIRQADLKAAPKQPRAQAEDTGNGPKMDTVILTQAASGLGQNLQVGQKVTLKVVDVNGTPTVEVKKEGESNWDRFTKAAKDLGGAAILEVEEAVNTDPAFIFRETVETIKDSVVQGAPEAVATNAIKGLYPGVRAGVLAADIYKAWRTLKDPNAGLASKILDVGHCVTDVGGLVAAAAPFIGLAVPGAAALAAIAYTADIIVAGFHALGYTGKKAKQIRAWLKKKQAEKENQKPSAEDNKPKEVEKDKETASGKKA